MSLFVQSPTRDELMAKVIIVTIGGFHLFDLIAACVAKEPIPETLGAMRLLGSRLPRIPVRRAREKHPECAPSQPFSRLIYNPESRPSLGLIYREVRERVRRLGRATSAALVQIFCGRGSPAVIIKAMGSTTISVVQAWGILAT